MAAEDEEFDERAFDNDDDKDEVSNGDVTAIKKSADSFTRFTRFRRTGRRIGRRIVRRIPLVRGGIRGAIRRGRRMFRRFRG